MTSTAAPEPIEVHLPDPPLSKFEREKRAFFRLLPELLHTHRGQYVAVHDERVIDSGSDQLSVALRAQAKVQAGVYVGLVSDDPPPVARSGIRRVLGGQPQQ
jgi:Family of unknown function (DUF5678)